MVTWCWRVAWIIHGSCRSRRSRRATTCIDFGSNRRSSSMAFWRPGFARPTPWASSVTSTALERARRLRRKEGNRLPDFMASALGAGLGLLPLGVTPHDFEQVAAIAALDLIDRHRANLLKNERWP